MAVTQAGTSSQSCWSGLFPESEALAGIIDLLVPGYGRGFQNKEANQKTKRRRVRKTFVQVPLRGMLDPVGNPSMGRINRNPPIGTLLGTARGHTITANTKTRCLFKARVPTSARRKRVCFANVPRMLFEKKVVA